MTQTGGRDEATRDALGRDAMGRGAAATISHPRDGRLDPLGEALRATYGADNHDTLSRDVTGLMLDLSRVPFEPHEFASLAPPASVRPTHTGSSRPGLLVRIGVVLRRARRGRLAG